MFRLEDVFVSESHSIKEAMSIIDNSGLKIGFIVNSDRKLLGVITDGDIRRGIVKGLSIVDNVKSVVNYNPVFASTDFNENYVLQMLKSQDLVSIPIVDENKVVQDMAFLDNDKLTFLSRTKFSGKSVNSVLVIGGAGYIGSVLVRRLLSKGYKVKILDLFLYGKESLCNINNPNLQVIEGDTRHVETLTNCVEDVDAVIHLAELVGDPACALNPKITQDINYLATMLVASVCKHYQINRMVYLSSCSVYGASHEEKLLNEGSLINPVSLYAKMKVNSENVLTSMADENFSPTILRLSTVYGWSPRLRFDLVVNTLTAKAISEGVITIFGGDQWRPNVHVSDVAKAIILALESPLHKVKNQVFNVGCEEQNYTINEIGAMVKKQVPDADLIVEDRNVDKRNYKVSFKKIREVLNFRPDYTIPDGIAELVEVLRSDPLIDYKTPLFSNVKFLESNDVVSNGDNDNGKL